MVEPVLDFERQIPVTQAWASNTVSTPHLPRVPPLQPPVEEAGKLIGLCLGAAECEMEVNLVQVLRKLCLFGHKARPDTDRVHAVIA